MKKRRRRGRKGGGGRRREVEKRRRRRKEEKRRLVTGKGGRRGKKECCGLVGWLMAAKTSGSGKAMAKAISQQPVPYGSSKNSSLSHLFLLLTYYCWFGSSAFLSLKSTHL